MQYYNTSLTLSLELSSKIKYQKYIQINPDVLHRIETQNKVFSELIQKRVHGRIQ